jgi:hypothetical protein
MSLPEPVMRNGIMTYAVPELYDSSCAHCCMRAEKTVGCLWSESLYEKRCADNGVIYIEATPKALAEYALAKE